MVVVVKDGKNGAVMVENDICKRVPASDIGPAHELTGAGDSFNAGVIAAILGGKRLDQAVVYGCAVAGAKIARLPLPRL